VFVTIFIARVFMNSFILFYFIIVRWSDLILFLLAFLLSFSVVIPFVVHVLFCSVLMHVESVSCCVVLLQRCYCYCDVILP
jgi:hypothetical protein